MSTLRMLTFYKDLGCWWLVSDLDCVFSLVLHHCWGDGQSVCVLVSSDLDSVVYRQCFTILLPAGLHTFLGHYTLKDNVLTFSDLNVLQGFDEFKRFFYIFININQRNYYFTSLSMTTNDECIRDIVVWFTDLSQWPCRWFLCPPVYICRFHYQLGWHLEFPVCEHFHHQWLWCVLMTRFPCCLWTICPWLLV